ncbi:YacL family protein [Thalassotalea agarivorans]|uniref:Uncharacterized protein n=1 Tax=Thalassotalea agarivorans TaxID=349064 RepID=A0A1H9Y6B2_THASX|nr:YacL family protein [Thalassotalea agarivorans]SES64425.1 hypothetical protein SAMN05660429_00096 [Thalassotalea agarivorans]
MEYEFINDSVTGKNRAKFSFEHELIGRWLESEIENDSEKLSEVLTAIDNKNGQEKLIEGKEYSVVVEQDDVQVFANVQTNNNVNLPEELAYDTLSFEQFQKVECDPEEFRKMLVAWSKLAK